jgi:GT2 family glycosyltransferase
MLKQQTIKCTLLLVDDGSTDGTSEMVKKEMPEAIILQGNGNLWWGGALHKAYKWLLSNALDTDIVVFSNDDVRWQQDYLQKGCVILDKSNKAIVSGLGFNENGLLVDTPLVWNFPTNAEHRPNKDEKANCCSTRSLFVHVKDMKIIGGFHPVLLPHYMSDYEWTIRASKKGYSIISDKDLSYTMDDKSTGLRDRKKQSIRQIFSKKSNTNPIVRINFILLSTPMKYWGKAFKSQIKRIT